MKSFGGLFHKIVSVESLKTGMFLAARGKRHRLPVMKFIANAKNEIIQLHEELLTGNWVPRPYTQFSIRDPKPRLISCAEFRDRIVHQSLCAHIGPCIERKFVSDSFACRIGKGSHRAVLRAQELCRRYRYFLKMDISKFFDSVNHDILLNILLPMFREKQLKYLLERIVRHPFPHQQEGCGIPIGNLTSQWFANLYLDDMDHWIMNQPGIGGYVRYMDDFVVWSNSKENLWQIKMDISHWVENERGLRIKNDSLPPTMCSEGLPFLGMRIFPFLLRLQHKRLWRTRRRVRKYEIWARTGLCSWADAAVSVRACVGIIKFFGLRTGLGPLYY